jgi:hypothetical protein
MVPVELNPRSDPSVMSMMFASGCQPEDGLSGVHRPADGDAATRASASLLSELSPVVLDEELHPLSIAKSTKPDRNDLIEAPALK